MFTSRNISQTLACASLLLAHACAGASHPDTMSPQATEYSGHEDARGRIVVGDLAKVQGETALDAVRQLRPEFLYRTGRRVSLTLAPPAPSVYENGIYLGAIDVLNLVPIRVVKEIRRVDAVEARSLFGTLCPCDGGAILVRTQP